MPTLQTFIEEQEKQIEILCSIDYQGEDKMISCDYSYDGSISEEIQPDKIKNFCKKYLIAFLKREIERLKEINANLHFQISTNHDELKHGKIIANRDQITTYQQYIAELEK